LGEITALPRPQKDLRGPTSKGRKRKKMEGKEGERGSGGEKEMEYATGYRDCSLHK